VFSVPPSGRFNHKTVKNLENFSLNKKSNAWIKFLIAGFLILFLVYILNLSTSPVKNYFFAISSPIQKLMWTAGASSSLYFGSFLNAGSLARDNKYLKEENQKMLFQLSFLQSISRGNQEFSQISAVNQNRGFDVVMAGVIGLEANDVLSINKGSADGIFDGMPVINEQGVLFGKTSKVYKNFSEVILLSNKDSIINVKIQKYQDDQMIPAEDLPPEISGVVRGRGGLSAYMDLIPINTDINLQDIITTSSMEKVFPKDLLVGRIIQKYADDQKPFQQAEINLFSDVSGLENLFVITNYKQAN